MELPRNVASLDIISRTLENIKDPEQVEKAVQTENVEKFVERNRQIKK